MLYLLHVETVRCSPGGDGDGDGQRLYNCADNGLVGGAGRGQAAAPLCNDTAGGDPLAS